jgi:quercetin dioxygenase-like cupin family protein
MTLRRVLSDGAVCPGNQELRILRWGTDLGATDVQLLAVDLGARSTPLAHSSATGDALVSNGHLGADVIRLAAGERFAPHTHPGDHLLIVIGGQGTITYDGVIYPTRAGEIYLVAGEIPHAVGAITGHVILAVGSPHQPVDSPHRMTPVAYEAVTSELNDLHCLICDLRAGAPRRLHEMGCPHCPCEACHAV